MTTFFRSFLAAPMLRRLAWYGRRVANKLDRRFFATLLAGAFAFVLAAAVLITLLEKHWRLEELFHS